MYGLTQTIRVRPKINSSILRKKHSKPPSYQIVIQKIGHLVAGLHEFQ